MTRTLCQIYFKYLIEKKGDHFDFLLSFCWTPCQNIYMINRLKYWTTIETLAKIESDCKERQLCMGDCVRLGCHYYLSAHYFSCV